MTLLTRDNKKRVCILVYHKSVEWGEVHYWHEPFAKNLNSQGWPLRDLDIIVASNMIGDHMGSGLS